MTMAARAMTMAIRLVADKEGNGKGDKGVG
jgi:hypothetical protein